MELYRIKTLNRIAPEGLALFDEGYEVGTDTNDPHGIVVRSSTVDTGVYDSLLAVARAGAGVNNITVDQATAQGICVFNTPGANANAVAELVFTMLGIWVRNIHQGVSFCQGLAGNDDAIIQQEVEQHKRVFRGQELAGKTLGVIGIGKIGVLVANGGLQRRMRVIGFDPFPSLENIHALSSEVSLARSMAEVELQADVLSLHLPLSQKTRGLVDRDFLARMRPGAILVNFARGPVVRQEAVLEALGSGQLGGYITDFPAAGLLRHDKILVSPHLGASTEESEGQCACLAVRELMAYLRYGNVSRSVNFPTAESIPAANVQTRFIMINQDIPDMIGFASHAIGSRGINIISYLNESNGTLGYNIIDLEAPMPADLEDAIRVNPGVIRTRAIPATGFVPGRGSRQA